MGRRKKSVGPAPRAFGDGGGARLTYLNTEPDGLGYDDDPEYRELVRDSEPGAGREWFWNRGFGSDVPSLIRQKRTFMRPGKHIGTIPGFDVPEGEGEGGSNFFTHPVDLLDNRGFFSAPMWADMLLPESQAKDIVYHGDGTFGDHPFYSEGGFDPSYLYSKLGFMNDIAETALGRAGLRTNGVKYVNDRQTGVGAVPNPNEVGFIREYVKDSTGSYMPYSSPAMQRGLTERDFENELVRRLAMQRLQIEYRDAISSGGAPTDRAGWHQAIDSLPLEEQVRRAAIDIGRLYGNGKAKEEFYAFMRAHPGADIERALSFFLSRNGAEVNARACGGRMYPLGGRPVFGDDDDKPYDGDDKESYKGWTWGEWLDYNYADDAFSLLRELFSKYGRYDPSMIEEAYREYLGDEFDEWATPAGMKRLREFMDEFAPYVRADMETGRKYNYAVDYWKKFIQPEVDKRIAKEKGEKIDTTATGPVDTTKTSPIDTTKTSPIDTLMTRPNLNGSTAASGIKSVEDSILGGAGRDILDALGYKTSDQVQDEIKEAIITAKAKEKEEKGDGDHDDDETSVEEYTKKLNEAKAEDAKKGLKSPPPGWSPFPVWKPEQYKSPILFARGTDEPEKPAGKERQERRERRQARLEKAMRLAPVFESAAGLLNPDLWRPDYRNANMLLSYRDRPPQVRWDQRADYYRPHWYPVENDLNRLSGETAANRRAVAALNPGNAVAFDLFNNYNAAKRAGEIRADAMRHNNEQAQLAAQINNQINQSDATGRYQAQAQNGQFAQNAAQQNAANWREGVRMRDDALTAMNEGRGTQLASAASNLAAYASEAQAIRSLGLNEWLKYKYGKGGFGDPVYKGENAACGGRLRAYGGGDDETYNGGELPASHAYWEPEIYVSDKRGPRRAARDVVRHSGADFIRRHLVPYPDSIPDWEHPGGYASAKLSSADGVVYPNVQKVNGTLVDFTDPSAAYQADPYWRALATGDAVGFKYPGNAEWFAWNNYKRFFPSLRGAYREARRNGDLMKRGRR